MDNASVLRAGSGSGAIIEVRARRKKGFVLALRRVSASNKTHRGTAIPIDHDGNGIESAFITYTMPPHFIHIFNIVHTYVALQREFRGVVIQVDHIRHPMLSPRDPETEMSRLRVAFIIQPVAVVGLDMFFNT